MCGAGGMQPIVWGGKSVEDVVRIRGENVQMTNCTVVDNVGVGWLGWGAGGIIRAVGRVMDVARFRGAHGLDRRGERNAGDVSEVGVVT